MLEIGAKILHKAKARMHLHRARAVLDTPPLRPLDDGVVIFSMIGSRVLLPYLVAVKSLHRQLGRGRVAILDDGTLTAADRQVLAAHLGEPEIRQIDAVDCGPCPRGGTWERLLTLLDLRRDAYVIQLDSDTVTTGPVPEVVHAIAQARSFTLRGDADAELVPAAEIAARKPPEYHRDNPAAHVQGAIESVLDEVRIEGLSSPRYARGCSGFAGFAPAASGRQLAERFSQEAERLLGRARWEQWGSEQVTSNFVIANEPDPLLLPYDRYLNFWNEPLPPEAAFVHFIGTYRYHRGAYAAATQRAIAALAR
ncbi:conserved hypothetical protein [Altererythrobacter sp. B11]|uniref:hypothetical protein n=1 Tax=Altererythrobacter sp. B11 TaxID=2060312 RepID=UPI000DC6D99C|nr:hypothetical protein [Altererythrobacter sp. B11]BBC72023.1 conserved hypothetical protein [Altererythrobacter sp. B11]